jgi:hypothetical protein
MQLDAESSSAPVASPSKLGVGEKQRNERNDAFWKFSPFLIAAIVVALIAFIIKRTSPRKTRRPPRTVPLPPSPSLNSTAMATGRTDESVVDLYLDGSVVEDESLVPPSPPPLSNETIATGGDDESVVDMYLDEDEVDSYLGDSSVWSKSPKVDG